MNFMKKTAIQIYREVYFTFQIWAYINEKSITNQQTTTQEEHMNIRNEFVLKVREKYFGFSNK